MHFSGIGKVKPDGDDTLRVLVVEDNEAAAQTTGWMVESLGYDYRLALTPDAAIVESGVYLPHVVLMDIGLPGMNGFELCIRLRAIEALAMTVFIAQTGWTKDEYRQRAKEAGFDLYLIKPVALADLEAHLQRIDAARS